MHRRLITNAVGKDGKKRVHSRVGQHHGTLRSCHYREAASLLEYDKSSQLAFMPTSCEAVGSLELLEVRLSFCAVKSDGKLMLSVSSPVKNFQREMPLLASLV